MVDTVGRGEPREHEDSGSVGAPLDVPTVTVPLPPEPDTEQSGIQQWIENEVQQRLFTEPIPAERIGRYVVLEPIGRGGMGIVYAAYDEQLDRKVAIKVLLNDELGEPEERLRFMREAQALARLSHPNVVTVHEVGESRGRIFLAMEHIKGENLSVWLRTKPPWEEVLQTFIQAGQGLVAAHAEGLVHRDFKPHNVMRSEDGRVKVLDFGLARAASAAIETSRAGSEDDSSPSVLTSELTVTGTILGTPAYMAPEQFDGETIDARSDQYSFCSALWEGLTGARPFAGNTIDELLARKRDSTPSWPTGTVSRPKSLEGNVTKAPAALGHVLLRGLSPNPIDRWPSMELLLSQLRAQVAPRSQRWLVAGVGAVVGLGLAGVGVGLAYEAEVGQRCTGARAELVGVWDESRRSQAHDAMVEVPAPYAATMWERVEARLDTYSDEWVAGYTEACEASRVREEQTAEEMSLRMGCLRRHRTNLRSTVDVLTRADADVLKNAAAMVAALPPLYHCEEIEQLARRDRREPRPEDPKVAEEVEALQERLADAAAEEHAGRFTLAREQLTPVVERASELGYVPLLAQATKQRGRVYGLEGQFAKAETELERAFELAVEHDLPDVQLEAAQSLIKFVGYDLARHDAGLQWAKIALPLARRRDSPVALARGFQVMGVVLQGQGKYEEAERYHRKALDAAESDDRVSLNAGVFSSLGNALMHQGKLEEAKEAYLRARQLIEQSTAPEHPQNANVLRNLSTVVAQQGDLEEAEALLRQARQVSLKSLGSEHPIVAELAGNLAMVLEMQGDVAAAKAEYELAISLLQKSMGPDHPKVAMLISNLAVALREEGKLELAEQQMQRSLKILEGALEIEHPAVQSVKWSLGVLLLEQRKLDEAVQLHQRWIRSIEDAKGPAHSLMARPMVGLAHVSLEREEFEAARAYAESAISLADEEPSWLRVQVRARLALASALWADPAQRELARAHVQDARDKVVEADVAALQDVEAWMADHPAP